MAKQQRYLVVTRRTYIVERTWDVTAENEDAASEAALGAEGEQEDDGGTDFDDLECVGVDSEVRPWQAGDGGIRAQGVTTDIEEEE